MTFIQDIVKKKKFQWLTFRSTTSEHLNLFTGI